LKWYDEHPTAAAANIERVTAMKQAGAVSTLAAKLK
jgi:hypothetical protein